MNAGLTIALCVLCSQMAPLRAPLMRPKSIRPLLADGVMLSGAQGKVIASAQAKTWHLELTTDVDHPSFKIPTKTGFELLPCMTLEAVIADVNDRPDVSYRIWARVTQYKGKEYLFPTYYLPLVRADGQGRPDSKPAAADSADTTQPPPDRGEDELGIPRAVLERVRAKRPSASLRPLQPGTESSDPNEPKRERLIHAVGRFRSQGDHMAFTYDAVGRRVQKDSFIVLPSMALELAERRMAIEPDPIRFRIAGIATEFKGKPYLLLQRATRAYSYGNLGR